MWHAPYIDQHCRHLMLTSRITEGEKSQF